MQKEQIYSLLRHVGSLIGGLLVAKGVADASLVYGLVGVLTSGLAIFYSIKEKTFQLGMVEGVLRQLLTVAGAFITFFGDPSTIEMVVGSLMAILSIVLGQTDKLWSDNSVPKSEEK